MVPQPSIIFFDEIDGLAPVRSVKQDQIHASVVSTLLALMDGLDSRGQVCEGPLWPSFCLTPRRQGWIDKYMMGTCTSR